MLGFRLELEELDFIALEAEHKEMEGDKEAQAIKQDKDAGEMLKHYNRTRSGFFGQALPPGGDGDESVSGGSVLMSRARRQHMLYRREASCESNRAMQCKAVHFVCGWHNRRRN